MPASTSTQHEPEPLLDLPGLARRLGVNERHVRRLVAERRIPYIKWGHLIRFDPDEVARWIDENRRPLGASSLRRSS